MLVNYSRSREDAGRTAADAARRELGRLDVLVNNAGTTVFVPLPELARVAEEDWSRIFGVRSTA